MKKSNKMGSKGAWKRRAPFQAGMNGKAEIPARPNNSSQERHRSRSDERKSIPPENTVATPHARLAAGWARIVEAIKIPARPNNSSQERHRSRSDERKSIPPENTVATPHARLAAGWARIVEAI